MAVALQEKAVSAPHPLALTLLRRTGAWLLCPTLISALPR